MDKEIYVKISACVSQEGAQRLQVLMKQVPDLTIDVQDAIADGKFAERWATVTPIVEMPEGTNTLHW